MRYKRAIGVLDRIVYDLIAERRRTGGGADDLLTMLLNAQDADTGERMSDKQLRDEAMTLLLAGHETSATARSVGPFIYCRSIRQLRKSSLKRLIPF